MFCKHVVVLSALLVPACWADFPDSRFQQGADGPATTHDSAVVFDSGTAADSGQTAARDVDVHRDVAQADDARVSGPDAGTPDSGVTPCTPGSFVGCSEGGQYLYLCRGPDQPSQQIVCEGGPCSAEQQRCTACDPNEQDPQCVDRAVEICTAVGLPVQYACSGTCTLSACCRDADNDGQTNCEGDCNDSDPRVFRGQTGYFDQADSRGSFDFNCDNVEESEVKGLWRCQANAPWGWAGEVVPCGELGRQQYGGKQVGRECLWQLARSRVNTCH